MTNRTSTKKFQRRVEDFDCAACGVHVVGDGYTNHCPKCLTSKHVDVAPGDRAAACGGLMPVMNVVYEHGTWYLVHQCRLCQLQKRNRVAKADDQAALADIMAKITQEKTTDSTILG